MFTKLRVIVFGFVTNALDKRGYVVLPVDQFQGVLGDYESRVRSANDRSEDAYNRVYHLLTERDQLSFALRDTQERLAAMERAHARALAHVEANRSVLDKYSRYNRGGGRRARAVRRVARELLSTIPQREN